MKLMPGSESVKETNWGKILHICGREVLLARNEREEVESYGGGRKRRKISARQLI